MRTAKRNKLDDGFALYNAALVHDRQQVDYDKADDLVEPEHEFSGLGQLAFLGASQLVNVPAAVRQSFIAVAVLPLCSSQA